MLVTFLVVFDDKRGRLSHIGEDLMSARKFTLILILIFAAQFLSVAQESADRSNSETEQASNISYKVDFQKIIIQNIPVTITLTPEEKKVLLHPVKVSLNDSVFLLNPTGNSYSFKQFFFCSEFCVV